MDQSFRLWYVEASWQGDKNDLEWDITPDDQLLVMPRSLSAGQGSSASRLILVTN